jgi:predicted MFS family arabinose efflux permease
MEKETRSTLIFLGSTHFLIHVVSQLLPAIIPILRAEFGISLADAGLLVSIPLIVQTIFYLPAGVAADRRGAAVLVLAFILTTVGAIIVPSAGDYATLLAAFILIALGSTLYHPPALRATSELPGEKKSLAMGIQNACGSLGYAAGPILLGILLPFLGWKAAFYVWVPFVSVTAIYSYRFLHRRETGPARTMNWSSFTRLLTPGFLIIVMAGALTDAVFTCVSTYTTTYLTSVRGVDIGVASIVFGAASLVGLAATLGGGALGDRLRRRTSYLLVIAGMALSVLLIPLGTTLLLVAVLYMVWRGLYSASMPLTNMLIADTSPLDTRSIGYSTSMIVSNLIGVASLMGVSWLMEVSGVQAVFSASAALLGVALILVIFYRPR